jgi:transcription factor S
MQFCDKCGGLMVPEKGKSFLVCRNCGKKKQVKNRNDTKIKVESVKKKNPVIVVEKKAQFETLPRTKIECPECHNKEAFWWMRQTRAGDEPPTRFHKCTKCSHVWREYE